MIMMIFGCLAISSFDDVLNVNHPD